jgi:hypothetical protein
VVARLCKVSWELVVLWLGVRGPFVAHGAKGEEEYPWHWLGGTSEVTTVEQGGVGQSA